MLQEQILVTNSEAHVGELLTKLTYIAEEWGNSRKEEELFL
jgi:hypothetical protein